MAATHDFSSAGTATRPGLLILALAPGVTTLSLLQSLVVPVLGVIAEQLHVSPGAVVSSTLAVDGVVGLVATGLLTGDGNDYRRPFWIGLAVTLLCLGLTRGCCPGARPRGPGGSTGGARSSSAPGWCCSCSLSPRGAHGAGAPPPSSVALAGSVVVLTGWVLVQRRTAEPLVRPTMLADRRTVIPNVAGLMTGIALFASFLVVLQYVQIPPELTGYGFGASVLEASVIYLLPGGLVGIVLAPLAGKVVSRFGALPTLLVGAAFGVAGFGLLAVLRSQPWQVIVARLLTQVSVTVAYAALPALVAQAVQEEETGVANAVNSIARSVGQALGSTLAVTLLAAYLDPGTGLPRDVAFTWVAGIGVLASAAVVVVAVVGMRGGPARRPDPLADVEEATARAGEWSPVSGIR